MVEEALSFRGIFNKKNGKVSQSYFDTNNTSENLFEDYTEPQDSENLTNYINFQNKNDSFKTAFKPNNQDKFDLKTYKKFLLFLKFQEMINEFNA